MRKKALPRSHLHFWNTVHIFQPCGVCIWTVGGSIIPPSHDSPVLQGFSFPPPLFLCPFYNVYLFLPWDGGESTAPKLSWWGKRREGGRLLLHHFSQKQKKKWRRQKYGGTLKSDVIPILISEPLKAEALLKGSLPVLIHQPSWSRVPSLSILSSFTLAGLTKLEINHEQKVVPKMEWQPFSSLRFW